MLEDVTLEHRTEPQNEQERSQSLLLSLPSNSVGMLVVKREWWSYKHECAFLFRVEVRFLPRHVMLEYFLKVDNIDI